MTDQENRVAKMSDEQILEILVDRTGWRDDVYAAAVAEAGKRNLKVGVGDAGTVQKQSQNIQAGLARDILDGLSLPAIIAKLEGMGIPPDVARQTAKQVALQVGQAERRACAGRFIVQALICAAGVLLSVRSYLVAGPGGTFFLAWGAVVFGGWKAYATWPSLKSWDKLLDEAEGLK